MFSLIETAKENRLYPYRYLTNVLTTTPNMDRTDPGWASQLLPANAPEQYRVPQVKYNSNQ